MCPAENLLSLSLLVHRVKPFCFARRLYTFCLSETSRQQTLVTYATANMSKDLGLKFIQLFSNNHYTSTSWHSCELAKHTVSDGEKRRTFKVVWNKKINIISADSRTTLANMLLSATGQWLLPARRDAGAFSDVNWTQQWRCTIPILSYHGQAL